MVLFYLLKISRGVAQLVARLTGGQEVVGSSPVTPTKAPKAVVFGALLITYSLFTLHFYMFSREFWKV